MKPITLHIPMLSASVIVYEVLIDPIPHPQGIREKKAVIKIDLYIFIWCKYTVNFEAVPNLVTYKALNSLGERVVF